MTFTREAVKLLRPKLTPADEKLRATLDAFEKWDGRVNAESTVAPIAAQMRIAFRIEDSCGRTWSGSREELPVEQFRHDSRSHPQGPTRGVATKRVSSYADLMRAAYNEAIANLTKNLGADQAKWTWGEMVKARFPHPLGAAPMIGAQFTIPPFPQNGTGGLIGATVNVGSGRVDAFDCRSCSDWDKTQQGIALGESGSPKSPHWSDQLADWRAVTPREFPFTQTAVAKATKANTGARTREMTVPDSWRSSVRLNFLTEVRAQLREHIRQLRAQYGDAASWTRVENIHITLKFFGNVAIDRHLGDLRCGFTNSEGVFQRFRSVSARQACFPDRVARKCYGLE